MRRHLTLTYFRTWQDFPAAPLGCWVCEVLMRMVNNSFLVQDDRSDGCGNFAKGQVQRHDFCTNKNSDSGLGNVIPRALDRSTLA